MASYQHYIAESIADAVFQQLDTALAKRTFPAHDEIVEVVRYTLDRKLDYFQLRLADSDEVQA